MADQSVNVSIRTIADNKGINSVERRLAMLQARSGALNTQTTAVDRSSSKLSTTLKKKVNPSLDGATKNTKKLHGGLKGILKLLQAFNKISLIVFGVVLAAGLLTLASVNAAFAVGRFAVKSYQTAMNGLAVTAAVVVSALSIAAAAMREFTAASYAYSYTASRPFETRLDASRAALRGLQSDAQLAVFGMEALNGAYAALSKNGRADSGSVAALRGLADFAAAGGDPAKNLQSAAEFIAILRKEGKLTQDAISAGSQVSEPLKEAIEEARKKGITSYEGFMGAITRGELDAAKKVEGQADTLSNTLVGQFKQFGLDVRNMFADMGQYLLGPAKEALQEIFNTIRFGIMRVAPEMINFGKGTMLDGLVSGVQKLTDLFVDLFRKYLAGSTGMIKRFTDAWNKTAYVFDRIVDSMRPLLDGGRAVIDLFGPAIGGVFGKLGEVLKTIDRLIVDNRSEWERFANAVKGLVDLLGDFIIFMIETFDRALPFLTPIIEVFTEMAYAIMNAAEWLQIMGRNLSFLGDGMKGFIPTLQMFGLLFGGMLLKNWKGGKGLTIGSTDIPDLIRRKKFERRQAKQEKAAAAAAAGTTLTGGASGAGAAGSGTPGTTPGGATPGSLDRLREALQSRTPGEPTPGGRLRRLFRIRGGEDAAGLGRRRRALNAFRGAGRGGAGFGGRMDAARTAWGRAGGRPGGLAGLSRMKFGGYGPGAALGILSPLVAEEAQGGVGTGAMIAGMAPMLGSLGPAAALAGVGLAGYSIAKNATTAKGGALGGAMAGGAAGAAIGSVVPVIGTVVGALIGAAAGAIIGAVHGRANGEKKRVEENVAKQTGQLYNSVANAMLRGNTDAARKSLTAFSDNARNLRSIYESSIAPVRGNRDARKGVAQNLLDQGLIKQADYEGFANAPETYVKGLEEVAEKTQKYADGPLRRFDQAMGFLTRNTGKTEKELLDLSHQMNVNLYDDTIAFTDVLVKLGLAVVQTKDQIVGAIRDIAIQSLQNLGKVGEQLKAPYVIRDIVDNFRNLVKEGTAATPDAIAFVTDLFNSFTIMFPDQPLEAVKALDNLLGPGGLLFGAGEAFAGMEPQIRALFEPFFNQFQEETTADARTGLIDLISNQLNVQGVEPENRKFLLDSISGMNLEELGKLSSSLLETPFFDFNPQTATEEERGRLQLFGGAASMVEGWLKSVGLDIQLKTTDIFTSNAANMDAEELKWREEIFSVVETAFLNKPTWMKDTPPWWTGSGSFFAPDADPDGDGVPNSQDAGPFDGSFSDTPSERFSRTLRQHSRINSLLPGARTITSGVRSNNLGSINSDHITGRAYDLTGQNLGAYATLMNKSGGFAEFHGAGGGRHLHVVPGEGPMGDTMSPMPMAAAVASPSSSVQNNYTIVVEGGSDPADVIARKVMDAIRREQRSAKERS